MGITSEHIEKLSGKVKSANIPKDLEEKVLLRLEQLSDLTDSPTFLPEYDSMSRYIDWIVSLPWSKRTKDNLDLVKAREILNKSHYGLTQLKDRIIEHMAVMKLKLEKGEEEDMMRAPILCFVGLVGTGKTTIARSIAEAMGRNFARIPFGGMGDPLDLRGQSRLHPEAEPGKVIKALRATQSKNCVILLDEIDRVTEEGRSSIMGVLVELLDPKQNQEYVDHYIDYPVDLSEVLFIATANNTHNIATAVLDRLEPIKMPSYTDEEKIVIGKKYIFPQILKESGIPEDKIVVEEEVWPQIVRPLGFDAGIRTLERNIKSLARTVAKELVEDSKKSFRISPDNVKQYMSA